MREPVNPLLLNALFPILVTEFGIVREPVNPLLLNAPPSILVSVFDNVREPVNPHTANALSPILVTELGIVREPVKLPQFKNLEMECLQQNNQFQSLLPFQVLSMCLKLCHLALEH